MSHEFSSRRRWFEDYMNRPEHGARHPSKPGVRWTCPCCGYPTLPERGGYEICNLCNWEDDGQDDPHADEVWGGPNGSYSLAEARANFGRYLIMYHPDKPTGRLGGTANTELEQRAKRSIVEAFDAMVDDTDRSAIQTLWQHVHENEELLAGELARKIRDYEKRAGV